METESTTVSGAPVVGLRVFPTSPLSVTWPDSYKIATRQLCVIDEARDSAQKGLRGAATVPLQEENHENHKKCYSFLPAVFRGGA